MPPRPPPHDTSAQLDARVWQAWGKADPVEPHVGPAWHPLLCHLLDVAACAQIVLTELFPARLGAFASALAVPEEDTLAWMLLAVALHDLGRMAVAARRAPRRAGR